MIARRRRLLVTAAGIFAAGLATLSAQPPPVQSDTPSTKGVVKKGKVPISNEILRSSCRRRPKRICRTAFTSWCSKIIGRRRCSFS